RGIEEVGKGQRLAATAEHDHLVTLLVKNSEMRGTTLHEVGGLDLVPRWRRREVERPDVRAGSGSTIAAVDDHAVAHRIEHGRVGQLSARQRTVRQQL